MRRSEPLGLESGTVVVADHDPRWTAEFTEAEREIQAVLGPRIIAVHHVGSTAVPGLCAKPILDILISVSNFNGALRLVPRLELLGYEFRPDEEIADRHYFRRRRGGVRTHHLSLAEPTSRYHRVTLAFRDALRADPRVAEDYCALKRDLASRFPRDRESYIAGKSEVVAKVLNEWASRTRQPAS
jgi:GrpB-like predicted nucleotidyltransferase (UPF0157 family)